MHIAAVVLLFVGLSAALIPNISQGKNKEPRMPGKPKPVVMPHYPFPIGNHGTPAEPMVGLAARKCRTKSKKPNQSPKWIASARTSTAPSVVPRALINWNETTDVNLGAPFGCFFSSTPGFCCEAVTETMIGMNCDKAVMVEGPNEDVFYSCPKDKESKQLLMSACCMPYDVTTVTSDLLLMECMIGMSLED